jgi:hypothetical protein
VKAAQDVFKHYMRIGQNSQIRVLISTNSTAPALEMISTDAMTWDECFADIFPGRSVASVLCRVSDGSAAQVRSPHLLRANDSILIEFD